MKNLFLDDWRIPIDCATYMHYRTSCAIYHEDWNIVRSYGQFKKWILENGLPLIISFDYDLCDVVELKEELPIEEWFDIDNNREYNGMDCAIFLVTYCKEHNLPIPNYVIHSANPDGYEKMKKYLENFKK